MKIPRATAIGLLLRPLPPRDQGKPLPPGTYELMVTLRIHEVGNVLPFLTDEEYQRAEAWLDEATALARTFQGRLAWQADPARH